MEKEIEIDKHARKIDLNISAIGEKRKWLDGLFDIDKQYDQPFYFSNTKARFNCISSFNIFLLCKYK
jgi:hypothetical protein